MARSQYIWSVLLEFGFVVDSVLVLIPFLKTVYTK